MKVAAWQNSFARFALLLTRRLKHTEKKSKKNQNPESINPNWNKPKTIYVEVKEEDKRIGKGKYKKEYGLKAQQYLT